MAVACAGLVTAQDKAPKPAAPPRADDMEANFLGLSPPPNAEAVARGQKTFIATCGFCHGSNATGGAGGPDLVRSVLVLHDKGTGEQIGPVILNGRPEKGMPKFNMNEAQIKDIAAFLLSRNQAAANRGTYKIQNVVTGDAKAGRVYFERHCASCHADGDLAHIASKHDAVALQSLFLYPKQHLWPGMPAPRADPRRQTTVTVTTPAGESVSGMLDHIDDFSVSLTTASHEHRSWTLGDGRGVTAAVHNPLQGHIDLLPKYTNADMHDILAYLETMK
jgi:cytochrome c oxidase cbb3-type subunit 3